jgi:hypothetical protein
MNTAYFCAAHASRTSSVMSWRLVEHYPLVESLRKPLQGIGQVNIA